MKRKWFIMRELIFPFCYTSVCVIMAIVGNLNGSSLATGLFSMFGVLSICIWAFFISYAIKPKSYYEYLVKYKERKSMDKHYLDKIKEEKL